MSTWLQALDAELEDKRARGHMRQFTPIQQDGVWVQALEAGSDTLPGSGAMFELASSARQDSTSNAVITSASKKGRWMLFSFVLSLRMPSAQRQTNPLLKKAPLLN